METKRKETRLCMEPLYEKYNPAGPIRSVIVDYTICSNNSHIQCKLKTLPDGSDASNGV